MVVRAEDFFAVDLVGVDFFAVDFFAVDFVGVDFFAVRADDVLLAVDLPVDLLAVDLPVDLLAVDLPVDLLAVDFLVGEVAVLFFAVVFFAADFAGEDFVVDAVFAEVDLVVLEVVAFGSFFAPDTTALRSAPGLNFGTAVFLARVRSPVRGLRTMRDGRTIFSKAPKPVMATFSPLDTSRVIVPRTDSRACCAAFLFPSKWFDIASMS